MPAVSLLSSFAAWRVPFREGWLEFGLRAYNLLNDCYRASAPISRKSWGRFYWFSSEKICRRVILFLRGNI
jgi:hypothetical protein